MSHFKEFFMPAYETKTDENIIFVRFFRIGDKKFRLTREEDRKDSRNSAIR